MGSSKVTIAAGVTCIDITCHTGALHSPRSQTHARCHLILHHGICPAIVPVKLQINPHAVRAASGPTPWSQCCACTKPSHPHTAAPCTPACQAPHGQRSKGIHLHAKDRAAGIHAHAFACHCSSYAAQQHTLPRCGAGMPRPWML